MVRTPQFTVGKHAGSVSNGPHTKRRNRERSACDIRFIAACTIHIHKNGSRSLSGWGGNHQASDSERVHNNRRGVIIYDMSFLGGRCCLKCAFLNVPKNILPVANPYRYRLREGHARLSGQTDKQSTQPKCIIASYIGFGQTSDEAHGCLCPGLCHHYSTKDRFTDPCKPQPFSAT